MVKEKEIHQCCEVEIENDMVVQDYKVKPSDETETETETVRGMCHQGKKKSFSP